MMIKKKLFRLSAFLVLSMFIVQSTSAKFWGWQTVSVQDFTNGNCLMRTTCRNHYILWIKDIDNQCNTETIVCSYPKQ
jgi:hypothetical protein